ncbi:nucleotidyltransferase family protein [Chloroflexota bacterium]
MKCLILASGFGTRLYPLTLTKAKALLDYKGKPVLSHIVSRVPRDVGIYVSTNRKFEADFSKWQKELGRDVELCVEDVWTEEQAKGAVGSLDFWVSQKEINEDLMVIAGDNYFEFNLAKLINAYNGKASLVAVYDIGSIEKANQFGVARLEGNKLVELQEKPANPKSSLVATGCYIFPPRVLALLHGYSSTRKRDNLGNLISYLIEKDEVYAYPFTEAWFDIALVYDSKVPGNTQNN